MSPNKRQIIDLTLVESPDAKRTAVEETVLAPGPEKEGIPGKDSTEDAPPHRIPVFNDNKEFEYRVLLPDNFTPATHPQILSEILDEAVMMYKDVKDKQACRWLRAELLWGKAPKNAMKNILLAIETKYNLPSGAIKESAVRKRLNLYLMMDKPSVSLIKDVEQCLLVNSIRMVKKHPELDVEKVLDYFEIEIAAAKRHLKRYYEEMDPALRAQYSLVRDHIQLDIYWARDMKDWTLRVLKQPGILEAFEFEEIDNDHKKNRIVKSEP